VPKYHIGDFVSVNIGGKVVESIIVNIEKLLRPTDKSGTPVKEMHGKPNLYVIDLETGHWARGSQIV